MVNYLLVSPFIICSQILERIIFNQLFDFIEKKQKQTTFPSQSGFWPTVSCENELVKIVHNIYAGLIKIHRSQ